MVRGIRTADYRGAETTCEVHGTRLEEDVVPIVYGLIDIDSEEYDAQHTLFPNAMVTWLGGCMIVDRRLQQARVRYCKRCREEHRAWHKAHPEKISRETLEARWEAMKAGDAPK